MKYIDFKSIVWWVLTNLYISVDHPGQDIDHFHHSRKYLHALLTVDAPPSPPRQTLSVFLPPWDNNNTIYIPVIAFSHSAQQFFETHPHYCQIIVCSFLFLSSASILWIHQKFFNPFISWTFWMVLDLGLLSGIKIL